MPITTESALPTPEIAIVDVSEQLTGNQTTMLWRNGYSRGFFNTGLDSGSVALASLHGGANFGTVSLSTLFEGKGNWQCTSASGVVNGRQSSVRWPIGRDNSGDPVSANRPLRWIHEVELVRTGPIVNVTGYGYGFRGSNLLTALSTSLGITVESLTAINGGRWTVFCRQVNGGALTVSLDTGIAGTTRVFLRWEYEDTRAPLLRLRINGQVILTLTGLANLPQPTAAQILYPGFVQGDGTLTGVGQVDRCYNARWRVEIMPGYDAV